MRKIYTGVNILGQYCEISKLESRFDGISSWWNGSHVSSSKRLQSNTYKEGFFNGIGIYYKY